MPCIATRSLSKYYGSTAAVLDVTMSVEPGQVFGFLGPNGAGKSTTIKMLTALVSPSGGELRILGVDALSEPLAVRKRIGVVLQQPSYEPTLSVERALDKYGVLWNVPSGVRRDRVEQLIDEFDLQDMRKKRNEDLSIGQRRRVQVAREFMHDMELLFLDEPTVGLDAAARRKLLDFLRAKVGSGLTIFYTTHILTEAEYLCDNIAIINGGKLLDVDTPESLKNRYGRRKTIRIRTGGLGGFEMRECTTDRASNTITITSDSSESVLANAIDMLNQLKIPIEDISIIPMSLEDVFLKVVDDASRN